MQEHCLTLTVKYSRNERVIPNAPISPAKCKCLSNIGAVRQLTLAIAFFALITTNPGSRANGRLLCPADDTLILMGNRTW